MIIRPIEPRDWEYLASIHSSSPAKYEIPTPDSASLITAMAVVDEDDRPRVVLMARRTAEIYLLMDHSWDSPGWRFESLKELAGVTERVMINLGYKDAYSFIGDGVPKSYIRRLVTMGWGIVEGVCLRMRKGGL